MVLVTQRLIVKMTTNLCKGSKVMAELVKRIPGFFLNRVYTTLVEGDGGGLESSR